MNKIIIPILIFILLILTIETQAQPIIKEIDINVTQTRSLSLFYVPIDRIDQFLDGSFDITIKENSKFLNKTYPIADIIIKTFQILNKKLIMLGIPDMLGIDEEEAERYY